MRCLACNRPFHATLTVHPNGENTFAKLCGACLTPKGEGYGYSHDFLHGIEEEPIVRVAKEKSIPTELY